MASGQISATLPFVKKTGMDLLRVSYASEDEAAQKIPAGLNAFYQQKYGDVWPQTRSRRSMPITYSPI